MNEDNSFYFYKAIVKKVYDGDTCTVDIDLGLGIWAHNIKIRFYRINAPEMRGKEKEQGKKSRDFLRSKIDKKDIILQTIDDGKGKYGRYLAEIWLYEDGEKININDLMVTEGYAEYKDYN